MSSYYERRKRRVLIEAERRILRAKVRRLFDKSRGSAGTKTLVGMSKDEGLTLGRCKVAGLMKKQGLVSKQPGPHKYKVANVERLDIPNTLDRKFDVDAPNTAWCGDITFI